MTSPSEFQRTPEWFQARLGKATASRFSDILARTKSGYSASRQNYLMELVCQRLTGRQEETYCSPAMQWGIDNEAKAKAAYEFLRGRDVAEVGFLLHPDHAHVGCSPDGLVEEGLIEIKCPMTAHHIETVRFGMPAKHVPQIQGQLWVAGAAWCDFVSYDPRLPPGLDLYVQRVERDEKFIETLAQEVLAFLDEVGVVESELRERINWTTG